MSVTNPDADFTFLTRQRRAANEERMPMKNGLLKLGLMAGTISGLIFSQTISALPASAQDAEKAPPKTFMMTPTGVNLLDAGFNYQVEDLSAGPLTLSRSYISSLAESNKYFSYDWTHNYDIWAKEQTIHDMATVTIVIGRTTMKFWGFSGSPLIASAQGDEGPTKVTKVSGNIILTDRVGVVYAFTPTTAGTQKISSITYPDGSRIDFSYSSFRPKTIASNRGYALVFDYIGTSNLVSAACAFNLSETYISASTNCDLAPLKTSYSYSSGASPYLSTATDVLGKVSQYFYDTGSTRGLTCIKPPSYSVCRISNTYVSKTDANGVIVVKTQTLADGSIWKFDCSCGSVTLGDPDEVYPIEWTEVTKPGGAKTTTLFRAGTLYKYANELGKIYEFDYSGRLPNYVIKPEKNRVTWTYGAYDTNGARTVIAKPNTGLPSIALEAKTYATSCNSVTCSKPITIADAKGNVTNLTYDPTHGGLTSEMRPAPASGAARPLKLVTYLQKYAYVKNALGALVTASAPVWLPNTMTECQTEAGTTPVATCDTAAPYRVTSYEYGATGTANNLLVRGMAVTAYIGSTLTTLRTCFGYDARGRKISTTAPRANLASCS